MRPSKKAISLFSSGLDSTVALALAKKEGYEITLAVTFDYGQRPAQQEISHAKKLCELWNISHEVIPLSFLENPKSPSPRPSLEDLNNLNSSQKNAQAVWVPNRNGVFLEIAAAIAEKKQVDFVVVGFNKEEATTFPDNSVSFLEAINRSLFFSTANHVEVISPIANMDKIEIVKTLLQLDIPPHFLWSCYENNKQMCGLCESCMRLKRALFQNKKEFHDYFENSNL